MQPTTKEDAEAMDPEWHWWECFTGIWLYLGVEMRDEAASNSMLVLSDEAQAEMDAHYSTAQ